MTIAIDFDGCYTLFPHIWKLFIAALKAEGHTVICVTARQSSQPPEIEVPVVYSPNGYKQDAAKEAGYAVDVWCDDMPGMIQRSLILQW